MSNGAPIPQPWERQRDEPAKWFSRFQRFLLSGNGRSIEGAWRTEARQGGKGTQKQVVSGHWHRSAKKWRWRERAEAWDAAQWTKDQKQIETERRDEARARRRLLRVYRHKLESALNTPIPRPGWNELTSALRLLCEQARIEFGHENAADPDSGSQIRGVIIMPPMEDAPQ